MNYPYTIGTAIDFRPKLFNIILSISLHNSFTICTFAADLEINNFLIKAMNQKIRIKLRSYDHNLVDKSTEKIVKTVRNSGAVISGPIPLPTKKEIFTVLRSPHVNKKSREQFQMRTHKRLDRDIYTYSENCRCTIETRTS